MGLGSPPPKLIEPGAFENTGSCVHKAKIELFLASLTISKLLGLKAKVASAALIAAPPVLTFTSIENVLPTVYSPVLGDRYNEAV